MKVRNLFFFKGFPGQKSIEWHRHAVLALALLGMTGSAGIPTSVAAQATQKGNIQVLIQKPTGEPLPNAKVTLLDQLGNPTGIVRQTNEKGLTTILDVAPGTYFIQVDAEKYDPAKEEITVEAGAITDLTLGLLDSNVVEVKANDPRNLIEESRKAPAKFDAKVIRTVPTQGKGYDAAFQTIPNVVRTNDGRLSIRGGRDDQNATLVNDSDSTDPATGRAALSIPLESIQSVEVYTNPILPENGKFSSGGVVKVETKRGGDKWAAEVFDFFPEPRFRGGKLFGLANFSPRFRFEGPIVKDKFFISQGFEFAVDKSPVRGLESPNNEIIRRFGRSFTQFDYLVSDNQTFTTTVNLSTGRTRHIGLDLFNPQPVAPNQKNTDIAVSAIDRLSYGEGGKGLFETLFLYKRLEADTETKGLSPFFITPTVRDGNYFFQSGRTTERYQLRAANTLVPFTAAGQHRLKYGVSYDYTRSDGTAISRPVTIRRDDGTVAQRIDYANTGNLKAFNWELTGFAQDQWLPKPNLSIDYGVRIESFRATTGLNVAPRLSVAYSPGKSGNTVIRASGGLFYDKVPLNAIAFPTMPRQVVTTFGADGVTPIGSARDFDYVVVKRSGNRPNRGLDYTAPRNGTFNLQLDQRINDMLKLRFAYQDSRTRNDFFIEPGTFNGRDAVLLQNGGRAHYRSFESTANFTIGDDHRFSLSYVRSKARGELNNFLNFFGDFPDPVIRPNQYGNLPSDAPNRFLAQGTFKLPVGFSLSPLLEARNGFPFSVRNANQDYVGVRNSDATRFPNFVSLDLTIAKELKLPLFEKRTAVVRFKIFNLTNHFNPRNVFANINGPQFGEFVVNYRRFYRIDFDFIF